MIPRAFPALKPVLALAMLTLVAACTTPFEARVQSFQSMPPVQGQSFVVKPVNPAHEGSLEFAAYAGLVATELQKQGFRPASTADSSDLTVLVDFGAGPGRERINTRPGTASTWGWYGRSWYGRPMWWGSSFYDPFWNQPEVYSFTVYPSFLEVDIRRTADKVSLFEGRAETTTRVNDLPATMPNLVTALFTDFPGASARSKVVRVNP
ncbi:DUF4136 domain-containing protein [Sandaracinobacteroides hominis]|uniref:DUF4136 domain-containing protein n=1 Tax=Sandaracinobacteroides hominis TaxID=2780086 RepID=UPI0018F746BB|nr:DUF4136 domain-containing protein [Sandaracinobacteroides hominis]